MFIHRFLMDFLIYFNNGWKTILFDQDISTLRKI